MITLAIDTSAHLCAAALHDDAGDVILAERSEDIGRGHAERLMDVIAEVLHAARLGYADLGRVAACSGPGSFTGVRVGLATARGIALGLDIRAVGVNALEAHAAEAGTSVTGNLLVAIEAGRGQAYAQLFGPVGGSPVVAAIPDLAAMAAAADALCGSAAPGLVEAGGPALPILHTLGAPPVARLARIGAACAPGARPEPLYLRPPDAKPQHGFAVARA